MLARTLWISTIALSVALPGLAGCASEDANPPSAAEVAESAIPSVEPAMTESPWSVRNGVAVPESGEPDGPAAPGDLVWGTGSSSSNAAAALPVELQFSGLYTAIATTGMVSLAWDAPSTNEDGTPLDDLAGYRVSYGPSSSDLSNHVNVGVVGSVELELPFGTHFVVVRAYDTWDNLSNPSNVIQVSVVAPS